MHLQIRKIGIFDSFSEGTNQPVSIKTRCHMVFSFYRNQNMIDQKHLASIFRTAN